MPKSIINSQYEFDQEIWVVSVLNTGSAFSGHSVIIVEGMKKNDDLFKESFIGQYDIKYSPYTLQDSSVNTKGYVCKVGIFESKESSRDYSQYQSKSFLADSIKVEEMIRSVKDDNAKIQQLEKMISEGEISVDQIDSTFIQENGFLEYQFVGKNSILGEQGAGDNCAGWTLDKLEKAGVSSGAGKPAPQKVAGGCALF